MEEKRKKSIVANSILFAIFIGLLIWEAFCDLQISQTITNPSNTYARIFIRLAEMPVYFVIISSCAILFNNSNLTKKKWVNTLLSMIFTIGVFGGYLIWFYKGTFILQESFVNGHYLLQDGIKGVIPDLLYISIAFALIFSVITIYFSTLVKKENMRRLFKYAVFALVFLAVSMGIAAILKLGWCRVRFRDMVDINSFKDFTPWYKPNGFGFKPDDFKESMHLTSFPSGHTTAACCVFMLVALCDVIPSWKRKKVLAYTFCFYFMISTMISRVMVNAHFLSDTTMAFFLGYYEFIILKKLFFKNGIYFKKYPSLYKKSVYDI